MELKSLLKSWIDDPVRFSIDCFGEEPDGLQKPIFEAVASHDRIAVRSGNGPGKTWTAAKLGLWFFVTRPKSIVVTTAPTWQQVQRILWKEIRANISKAPILRPFLYLPPRDAEVLMIRPDGSYGDDWAMIGRASDKKENMLGFHAPYLMFIVDEASGVPDEIFEAIEGTQTQEGVNSSKILLIGNPTRPEGFFYDIFHSKSSNWKTFHLDGRLSPRVSKQWISQMEEDYGGDSPFFQIHVLGNFPPADKNTLIPLSWIERALVDPQGKGIAVSYAGFDVAEMGDDYSVYIKATLDNCIFNIYDIDFMAKLEISPLTNWAKNKLDNDHVEKLVIDSNGVGAGVYSNLKEEGYPVIGFRGGESPLASTEEAKFSNLKSQAYWNLRALFEKEEIKIQKVQNYKKLVSELSTIKYDFDSKGKIIVKREKDRKSPDFADALCLCCFAPYLSAQKLGVALVDIW